jgi:hypothetical protein
VLFTLLEVVRFFKRIVVLHAATICAFHFSGSRNMLRASRGSRNALHHEAQLCFSLSGSTTTFRGEVQLYLRHGVLHAKNTNKKKKEKILEKTSKHKK